MLWVAIVKVSQTAKWKDDGPSPEMAEAEERRAAMLASLIMWCILSKETALQVASKMEEK